MTVPTSERGSVLVEALIASAILAMILAATFQTLQDSARRARRVADQRTALLIAQSRLAEYPLNRAPVPGSRHGEELGYRWHVDVSPTTVTGAGTAFALSVLVTSRRDASVRARLDSLRPGA
jgi:type II secretion system protein I